MPTVLKDRLHQNADFENDAGEAMLNLFVAGSFMRQKMSRVCESRCITQNQYNILRILRGAPEEGYPRCDIIGRMADYGADVTRLVDVLVIKGLVSRCRSTDDRRNTLHKITSDGATLLAEMADDVSELIAFFASRVSDRDQIQLSRICEGIYSDF